jgi:hypothetical protein
VSANLTRLQRIWRPLERVMVVPGISNAGWSGPLRPEHWVQFHVRHTTPWTPLVGHVAVDNRFG